ncbi:cupin domain-containing protein [Streptomyces sp. NPDC059009]|uniref:cupin domain-containing protein n=1 Tax=Streptomyces sp. NPDC059009 TaxID=3346694 RepID=UPI00368D9F66
MHESPRVLLLAARAAELADPAEQARGGALWRLPDRGRQLDANVLRLPPDASVAEHVESDVDVILVVAEGGGHLDDGTRRRELTPGTVVWLPRTARRALSAGPHGLTYVSVHQRRAGMAIGGPLTATGTTVAPGAVAEGGEPACALNRVCPACGRLGTEAGVRYCGWCGEELPGSVAP